MIAADRVPTARGLSNIVAIMLSCLGVAVAAWLIPASVEIVAWPTTGPMRMALFALSVRLWVALSVGVAAGAVLCIGGGREARARMLAPLSLTWLWTVPYWPWLPDRAPVLLVLAGPLRWVIAGAAIAGSIGMWAQSREWHATILIGRRPTRAAVFVVTLALYVFLGLWSLQTVGLGGDEPQYLIITHSLLADRDLQIENNHRRGDYHAFFRGELPPDYLRRGTNGEIYSVHAPGLPALLLPAYAIGGAAGAVIMMCVLGALAALAVFDVATPLGGSAIGLLTWASVCLTVPWMPYSWSLFPEMAGAAIVAWAVVWLVEIGPPEGGHYVRGGVSSYAVSGFSRTPGTWLWRGACLGLLPWLHTKFVVLLAALTLLLLWRVRSRLTNAAAFLVPILVSSVMWLGFFYVVYGTPDPQAPYGTAYTNQLVRFANVPRSLLGLLFDQKFGLLVYSPVYFVAAAGVWVLICDRAWRGLVFALVLTALPYVVSSSRYYMWWGGSSAPARFLVPVLPLLAPMVAAGLARIRTTVARAAVVASIGIAFLLAACGVFWPERSLLFSEPHGIARVLETIQGSAPLAVALPTFTEANWRAGLAQLVPWIVAALLTAALALLVARTRRRASVFWIAAIEAIAFLFVGSILSGPFSAEARAASALRGKLDAMQAYDPEHLRGFEYATMATLDDGGVLRACSLAIFREGRESAQEGRIAGPLSLPPGRYTARVWFEGDRQRDGDLMLSLGRGHPAARVSGPLPNPAALAFNLPISVGAIWLALSDTQSARAVRRVEITPLSIVARPNRLEVDAVTL